MRKRPDLYRKNEIRVGSILPVSNRSSTLGATASQWQSTHIYGWFYGAQKRTLWALLTIQFIAVLQPTFRPRYSIAVSAPNAANDRYITLVERSGPIGELEQRSPTEASQYRETAEGGADAFGAWMHLSGNSLCSSRALADEL